jgi:hypothetical protein
VLLGVQGKGAIERVVDYADEWMPLDDEPPSGPGELIPLLDRYAKLAAGG